MKSMDTIVTMDPAEGRPECLQNILEDSDKNLFETASMLREIISSLRGGEDNDMAGELKVSDLRSQAININLHTKLCAAMAHEIFKELFGQH